jgi:predicted nucleic acid-binding protein
MSTSRQAHRPDQAEQLVALGAAPKARPRILSEPFPAGEWERVCGDCSLVVDALSAREGDEVLRQQLSAPRTLHAPHHLDVEVASTVRGLAAGKRITDHRGEQMLADYSRLRIARHPVWPYHPRMWELRHNLGAYDAAYIALAEALGCELLTGDVKVKNAAGHHATVIVTR